MDSITQIKQKLDIVDVIAGYISVKKSGKNYKAVCPFHSEDTPSFMISQDIQRFKCFGCGEAGDMFNFVQKIEGVEFFDALEILAEKAGVKIEKKDIDPSSAKKAALYNINEMTMRFYHYVLIKHSLGKPGLAYVTDKRKLTPETIENFKLGYAPDKWDLLINFLTKKNISLEDMHQAGVVTKKRDGSGYIDKFRGRVIFPLIDVSGKVVGFTGRDIIGRDPKYLNTEETLIFHKSNYLYALDKAKVAIKKKGAVFVEGQVDVLTAFQNGAQNVIASSGTSLTHAQLKTISRYTKDLTFCFDPDSAGIAATSRATTLAEDFDFNINAVLIPSGYADLDVYFKQDKDTALVALLHPIPVYDYFLATALRQFDTKTAFGKKELVNYLLPIISRIKSQVVLDHYILKLSSETGIGEEALRNSIKTGTSLQNDATKPSQQQNSTEVSTLKTTFDTYILTLLIKGNIDTISHVLYKLDVKNFTLPDAAQLYIKLREYIDSKPQRFDIQYFIESYVGELKELVLEMYLLDLGELETDQKAYLSELESVTSRIKTNTTKRELKNITEQIRLAELEKDTKKIEELSMQFRSISENLN